MKVLSSKKGGGSLKSKKPQTPRLKWCPKLQHLFLILLGIWVVYVLGIIVTAVNVHKILDPNKISASGATTTNANASNTKSTPHSNPQQNIRSATAISPQHVVEQHAAAAAAVIRQKKQEPEPAKKSSNQNFINKNNHGHKHKLSEEQVQQAKQKKEEKKEEPKKKRPPKRRPNWKPNPYGHMVAPETLLQEDKSQSNSNQHQTHRLADAVT